MNVMEKMQCMLDFQSRHYIVFVLSHQDADEFSTAIGRATGQPLPPDKPWRFYNVPVVAGDVRRSYIVEGWDQPLIHML